MGESDSSIEVRSFEEADRSALEALWSEVFGDDPLRNAPLRMIDQKLRVQPELLLVARIGDALVGAIMAGYDGVRGWLYHLAVAPEHRGRGVATRLVRDAESRLGALGCSKVNLQIRASNAAVKAFYEKLGYSVEERVGMGRVL
jgi:ribosomal protein S18 acetylase RimI-like enzyme